ncbi:hypothetical protein D3C71_1402650 [compost metagenome]
MQGVVVGGFKHLSGLDTVHPQQEAAAFALGADALQHGVGVFRAKVADAGTGVEEQPLCFGYACRQGQHLRKILADRRDVQIRVRQP